MIRKLSHIMQHCVNRNTGCPCDSIKVVFLKSSSTVWVSHLSNATVGTSHRMYFATLFSNHILLCLSQCIKETKRNSLSSSSFKITYHLRRKVDQQHWFWKKKKKNAAFHSRVTRLNHDGNRPINKKRIACKRATWKSKFCCATC